MKDIKINESKKYLIFEYQDIPEYNNLINKWYSNNKLIILDKKEDNIIVKLAKDNYSLNNKQLPLHDTIDKVIDLLSISTNIRISITNKIKLYTNNYTNILNNLLLKENDYYLLDINREKELYYEISKYNKYTKIINYKDINNNTNFTLKEVIDKINNNNIDIRIIKDKNIKVYIDNELFIFNDILMFNNIYLPEIIKKYSKYNNLEKSSKDKQFRLYFLNINDNFYLINFKEEEIDGCLIYLKELTKKNNIDNDLKENYTFIKDIETLRPNYSYGYVSIIFISLIMSIITIIVALMNI